MNLSLAIISVIIGCVIGSYASILFKRGANKFTLNLFKLVYNYEILGGIVLYVISLIIFIIALKGNPLSIMYPLVSTSYIWVVLFSVKYLGEKMNFMKWLGVVSIIIGVSFIGIGS